MGESPWFWIGIFPAVLETLVLFAKPAWLSGLAFIPVREHRFTLKSRRRDPATRGGYREPGRRAVGMPELPARTELRDSVLAVDGERIALRRAWGFGRRQIWLVGIDVAIAGDEVVLRAKQAVVPMTLPLAIVGMMIAMHERDRMPPLLLGAFPLLVLFVLGLQHAFSIGSRDDALAEAFSFLEDELRRGLEEPAPRAGFAR